MNHIIDASSTDRERAEDSFDMESAVDEAISRVTALPHKIDPSKGTGIYTRHFYAWDTPECSGVSSFAR